MSEGKMKYDILRNGIRRMLAEGKFSGSTKTEIETILESVREESLMNLPCEYGVMT